MKLCILGICKTALYLDTQIICGSLEIIFQGGKELLEHLKTEHGGGSCLQCGTLLGSKQELDTHAKVTKGSRKEGCFLGSFHAFNVLP